jgi:hypothetical protein
MSDISNGADPLKEMVDQMKRDAYAAGWSAAMEAVSTALNGIVPFEIPSGASTTVLPAQTIRNSSANSSANSQSIPTVGTTPHYVYEAVRRKQGMTGAEVIDAVRADGHSAAEPQIRTALSRLEKRQLLANRHRKWFLK